MLLAPCSAKLSAQSPPWSRKASPTATRASAAARYMAQRIAVHDALRSHRVGVLDVTCEQLPGALVERYLAVKRDGVL